MAVDFKYIYPELLGVELDAFETAFNPVNYQREAMTSGNGIGVEKNKEAAEKWLRQASSQARNAPAGSGPNTPASKRSGPTVQPARSDSPNHAPNHAAYPTK